MLVDKNKNEEEKKARLACQRFAHVSRAMVAGICPAAVGLGHYQALRFNFACHRASPRIPQYYRASNLKEITDHISIFPYFHISMPVPGKYLIPATIISSSSAAGDVLDSLELNFREQKYSVIIMCRLGRHENQEYSRTTPIGIHGSLLTASVVLLHRYCSLSGQGRKYC